MNFELEKIQYKFCICATNDMDLIGESREKNSFQYIDSVFSMWSMFISIVCTLNHTSAEVQKRVKGERNHYE